LSAAESAVPIAGAGPRRPVPQPDGVSAGYWEAAYDARLAIQRCARCRRWYHPPVLACPQCRSRDLAFENVGGRGTIHQRVIVHQTKLEGFEASTPYSAATIELDEQPGLYVVANLVDCRPGEVEIGQRVRVVFEPDDRGVMLPQFAPDEAVP
jgi:uncharacterized protein